MNAFLEGFVVAIRMAASFAAVASSALLLYSCAVVTLEGYILPGFFFSIGSLWLLRESVPAAWANISGVWGNRG